jgi:hypothetical protein
MRGCGDIIGGFGLGIESDFVERISVGMSVEVGDEVLRIWRIGEGIC